MPPTSPVGRTVASLAAIPLNRPYEGSGSQKEPYQQTLELGRFVLTDPVPATGILGYVEIDDNYA
jgi:hypothetical protein